jgi:hypothetical protein
MKWKIIKSQAGQPQCNSCSNMMTPEGIGEAHGNIPISEMANNSGKSLQ